MKCFNERKFVFCIHIMCDLFELINLSGFKLLSLNYHQRLLDFLLPPFCPQEGGI